MRAPLCVLGCLFVLGGCAQYAEVSHVRPCLAGASGSEPLAVAERTIAQAMQEERTQPLRALGDCLLALKEASRELERDPENAIAIRDYNFGIARIFQIVHG